MKYAGFWSRFGAMLIDGFILSIVSVVIVIPMMFVIIANPAMSMLSNFLIFVLVIFYHTYFTSKKLGTPGKIICGLEVRRSTTNRRISYLRSFCRVLAYIPSAIILYIGFLISLFTKKRQALHDLIVGTVVLRNERKKSDFWKWFAILFVSYILMMAALVFLMGATLQAFILGGGIGSADRVIKKDLAIENNIEFQLAQPKHDIEVDVKEFVGDSSNKRVLLVNQFQDIKLMGLDKPFFERVGPFAIYAEGTDKIGIGGKMVDKSVKLVVYAKAWHGKMKTENLLPMPSTFVAHIVNNEGKRISTNKDDYLKVELKVPLNKEPLTSGLNGEGIIDLTKGSKFDDIVYISGILQAKFPQKLVQYEFFAEKDFGVNYKIDDSTIIHIGKEHESEDGVENTASIEKYVLKIMTLNKIPFEISFKTRRGRSLVQNEVGYSSQKMEDGKTLYSYTYEVANSITGAKLSIPFNYKDESYPFKLKRIKKNGYNVEPARTQEQMSYQKYLSLAKRGNTEAQYRVAFMLNQGLGVRKNTSAAKAWLKKAAQQGHEKAQKILESLKDK